MPRALSRLLIPVLVALVALAGCGGGLPVFQARPTLTLTPTATVTRTLAPTITPTPTPRPPQEIRIEPSVPRQTLREVGGGNFIHYFGMIEEPLDPISQYNFRALMPKVVRARIDLDQWVPRPGAPTAERYQDIGYVHATFEFLRVTKAEVPEAILIASIWEVPNWMVANPDDENGRIIPPENYNAAIEAIAAWLQTARAEYGVEVDYISFNEADLGINIRFTPEEQVAFIRKAGSKFLDLGLKTRFLLGDTSNMASVNTYVPPIYDAADIRPFLGPLSFHSWDFGTSDTLLKEIGRYADQNRLEVWCTEAGWDASQWNRPIEFASWKHALRLANIYTRVLRDTRATTMLYWEMMGHDYQINDGTMPFPALVYLTELRRHFPAGAQLVKVPDSEFETIGLLTLAARTPDSGFSVQVMSTFDTPRRVILSGVPNGSYTVLRLSEADMGRKDIEPVAVTDFKVELELAPQSIYFFMLAK